MCGIWAVFGCGKSSAKYYASAFKIAHRGPDCYHLQNITQLNNCALAFHRLTVVDNVRGMQPMRLKQYPHLTLMCNGEIYNFDHLRKEFGFDFESACDCEIILHLYHKFGIEETCKLLDGVFALIIVDTKSNKVMFARDTHGVRPMFYFDLETGLVGACSEAKGLSEILNGHNGNDLTKHLEIFPPAHFMVFGVEKDDRLVLERTEKFHEFHVTPNHWQYQGVELNKDESEKGMLKNIRTLLKNAVDKRLMSSRRVGSLLSGGLDSSLVAAIAAKKLKERNCELPLATFSIGIGDSPDILAARKVAKHIGSDHHEISFTPEEGLAAIDNVIYSTESFDLTTIRASTPMYLISKYISEQTDTIVILSGEGADEIGQGYIYFHKQPSTKEGDAESRRILKDLYMFDVLRTDRSTAAHGLEVRAPFLDHAFTSYFLSLPGEYRRPRNGIEKYIIRSAFDNQDLIPTEILWRKKEAFSDGVSSEKNSWFQILHDCYEKRISDEAMKSAHINYPENTPTSKEALYYRQTFEKMFSPSLSKLIPYTWLPRWVECNNDPSARMLALYKNDEN